MKVLVLGATGNVGSRLIPALLAHNHTVVAYVRSPSKLPAEVNSKLSAVVAGSGSDSAAIKAAILMHNCNAVVNTAGLAASTSWHKKSDLPDIFAAVAKVAVEAQTERGGEPLRVWFMSGILNLDAPIKPYLLQDYLPMFPEHIGNCALIKTYPTTSIAWSLFCASLLVAKYSPPKYPAPAEASADNVVAKADSLPEWKDTYMNVPLVGPWLNIFSQVGSYGTITEDSVDFLATDLDRGLGSEWIGKKVGLKEKAKAG